MTNNNGKDSGLARPVAGDLARIASYASVVAITVYLVSRDVRAALAGVLAVLIVHPFVRVSWERAQRAIAPKEPSRKPAVIWFTGLSGAGKTTIARRLYARLKEEGVAVEFLDGDITREFLPTTGFSREERSAHLIRAAFIAKMLEQNGITVVVAYISPYEDTRRKARAMCRNFVEVYVATPIEECERRDVKGLYAKVRKGEIKDFTGVDSAYEPPSAPELTIDTLGQSPDESCDTILKFLET